MPPAPICPSPPSAVEVPNFAASIGGGAGLILAPYSSTITTCTTTAVVDGVPTLPARGLVAQPGDLLTLVLPSGWRFLRWEGSDSPMVGDAANVDLPIDTPQQPRQIEIPVPIRSGDSQVGLTLWIVSVDGRAVAQVGILVRVNVG